MGIYFYKFLNRLGAYIFKIKLTFTDYFLKFKIYFLKLKTIYIDEKSRKEFRIFHLPKTGGSYCIYRLVGKFNKRYILPHKINYNNYLNYHYKNDSYLKITPVALIREPIDFYISLISFWLLDPKKCGNFSNPKYREKVYCDALNSKNGHVRQILGLKVMM